MKTKTAEYYLKTPSPIGTLYIIEKQGAISSIVFEGSWAKFKTKAKNEHAASGAVSLIEKETPLLKACKKQLKEYFGGRRQDFDLPLIFEGTNFEQKTWQALNEIPFGKTLSYGEQAKRIKNPKAVRAVGRANGKNPLPIIVPCHRVVGSSGALTGYAGGLSIKRTLLELEASHVGQSLS